VADIQRKLSETGINGTISITEYSKGSGDIWLEIRILGTGGGEKGAIRMPRKDFLDALEKFWPGEVAYQFEKTDE